MHKGKTMPMNLIFSNLPTTPFKQKTISSYWLAGLFWLLPGLVLTIRGQDTSVALHLNKEVTFENYSLAQGLSNKSVLAIHQDLEGFLWVGTRDGLNRFDGYRFTVYPFDSTHAMPYTIVTGIHEDRNGRMWITTFNKGLWQFDKRTGKFTSYRIELPNQNERNTCMGIFEDQRGMFWIPSPGGLNRFDPNTGRFTMYANPNPDSFMFTVCQDASGGLWVGTNKGLFQFDPRTGKYTLVALGSNVKEKAPTILASYRDSAGMLWMGALEVGLYRLNPTNQQFTLYRHQKGGLLGNHIYKDTILEDANGTIWMGTNQGLQQFSPKTGRFTAYQTNVLVPESLKSNDIWSIHLDRAGLLWVGTAQGLHRMATHPMKIQTYQLKPDPNYSRLPENSLACLYEDRQGILWLSNDAIGGLYRFDRRKNQLTRLAAKPGESTRLLSDKVRAVHEDQAGVLWVLAGKCLHALEQKTGLFTRYPMQIEGTCLGEDRNGQLWVGGEALASFEQKSKRFTYYRHDLSDTNTLGSGDAFPLLISRSGAIWIGMANWGLSKLEPKTGKFTHYRPDFTHSAGHFNDLITSSFYEDEAGILWVGTTHGGLNRFDPGTGLFHAYTTHDGLPTNAIASIQGDHNGYLWLSTNQGISRFDPRTQSCRNYDQGDGLQDNEFYNSVSTHDPSGELLFGGPNGFNVFHPDSLQDNRLIPSIHLISFTVLDKPRVLATDRMELSYRENFLSFEFAALNYVMPEKNQYAYQLVGVDEKWVYAGTRRFARYTNLDPGEYTFRVKGSNNDGVWNEQGLTIFLLIHPPWWRTNWFITLAIATIIGLIYGGFRYRIGKIRKEEAQKTAFHKAQEEQKTAFHKKVSELEMQALRAQMNPHFIFNCLNSINRFILKNQSEAASDYLAKFSRLIRLILQNSSALTISLESELEALDLYLKMEALRFEDKFTFHIHWGEEVEIDTDIPPLIIQPYVENAIWHGLMHKEGTGHIAIAVRQEYEMLTCIIEDDGIGRQRAAELKSKSATKSKSLGMQITTSRLELLSTLYGKHTTVEIIDLVDPAGKACGTRVLIQIPI
jgi:ligand-binding sensor domain-containing protein